MRVRGRARTRALTYVRSRVHACVCVRACVAAGTWRSTHTALLKTRRKPAAGHTAVFSPGEPINSFHLFLFR